MTAEPYYPKRYSNAKISPINGQSSAFLTSPARTGLSRTSFHFCEYDRSLRNKWSKNVFCQWRGNSSRTQSLRNRILQRFRPSCKCDFFIISCDEWVQVIWHSHLRADTSSMRRAFLPKAQRSFVDCCRRKKFWPIFCAGDDEVDGLAHEQELEAMQALLSSFGGHRPPLQFRRAQTITRGRRMFGNSGDPIQTTRNRIDKIRDMFGNDCLGSGDLLAP